MATISENLQIIKDSTAAIKQAIIDKGGTIEGDITTWASAINGIESGGGSDDSTPQIKCFSIEGNGKFPYEVGMTWTDFFDSEYSGMCLYVNSEYLSIHSNGNTIMITKHGLTAYLKKPNGPNYIYESELIDETITDYDTYINAGDYE